MHNPAKTKPARSIFLAATLAILALTGCDRNHEPGTVGRVAPQFVIGDGSTTVDLSKFRGKVVVLNLWATWCEPCVEELPSLLALQQRLPDLAVVGVSTDQDDSVYHQFLTRHNVTIRTVRDADQRVNALYGTVMIPETYIIDRKGIIRRKFIGAQKWTSPEMIRFLSSLESE